MEIDPTTLAESSCERIQSAYQLVDWLRFVGSSLQTKDIVRLAAVVERFHSRAMKDLFENLHPCDSLMWEGGDLKNSSKRLLQVYVTLLPLRSLHCVDCFYSLSFDWLFIQSSEADIADKQSRQIMLECLFLVPPPRVQIEHALCLVVHDIGSTMKRESLVCDLLLLVSSIMHRALGELSKEDGAHLKEYLLKSPPIHDLCLSGDLPDIVQEGNTLSLVPVLSLMSE